MIHIYNNVCGQMENSSKICFRLQIIACPIVGVRYSDSTSLVTPFLFMVLIPVAWGEGISPYILIYISGPPNPLSFT
jgi:hypothetical protein